MRSPRRRVTALLAVRVEQGDLDLAAVAGVDRARGVDDRDPVPRREARAGVHEGGVAVRAGRSPRRSGRSPAPAAGATTSIARDEVGAGVAGVGVGRDGEVGVQPSRSTSVVGRPSRAEPVQARDVAVGSRWDAGLHADQPSAPSR